MARYLTIESIRERQAALDIEHEEDERSIRIEHYQPMIREPGDLGTNYEVSIFHDGWRVWYDPKPVYHGTWDWSAEFVGRPGMGWSALHEQPGPWVLESPDTAYIIGSSLDEVLEIIDHLEDIKRTSTTLN